MSDETPNGWDGRHEHPLCVTLERSVSIPGPDHSPPDVDVFRAGDWSKADDVTMFFNLNIGPDNTVVEIANDNIRGVAVIGDLP